MRLIPFFMALFLPLFGQQELAMYKEPEPPAAVPEKKPSQAALENALNQALQPGKAGAHTPNIAAITGSSDVMLVDPKVVSEDWVSAFSMLRNKKVHPTFVLKDQTTITDVDNLTSLPGGYLMLFTVRNINGYSYKIVKTSDISSLETE